MDWRLLLVDDEEGIRKVMRISLEDAGYRVATAADGAEGLSRCESFDPQILITDIRMPGMDGLELLAAVKKRWPGIEVIVMTAFGEMNLAIRALQLDASDFITKPLHDEALFLALKRARDRFRVRQQVRDYTTLLEAGWARTARELMDTFAFQRNLIDGSLDGILGCGRDDTVVIFNRSMEKMLGHSRAQVVGQMTLADLLRPGENARFRGALASQKWGGRERLALFETTLMAKDGQEIPVQVSAAVLPQPGKLGGLVCFFRDLREVRRLEQEVADQARILHQDKMMSLGRLAASVVHEINNPLAGILNYTRLMLRVLKRGPLEPARQADFSRYLALVETETDRCARIVASLLAFSRKSPPAMTEVSLRELLNRCALMSRHKLELQNIEFELLISEDLPPVRGDANQLQQCIINLIFNAIDAMPQGGRLRLEAQRSPGGNEVTITVTDSGAGIPAADLPHIFEPFFTTKAEGYGVGLGLSTVFGIMQRHKGAVTAKNVAGKGAAFTLHLPLAPAGASPREA
jgi:PAS domain S-box-containing protein